jgi:hypothetical protein
VTKSERRQVAATLREWAAWCEANPTRDWWDNEFLVDSRVWLLLCAFCDGPYAQFHTGPTAATGLLLAAAMVEAGDVP